MEGTTASNFVTIGYVPVALRSSLAFPVPRLLLGTRGGPIGPRAVQACPAVNTFESRTVEILAPFSLRLRCIARDAGNFDFHLVEDGTRLDEELLQHHVTFMPRQFWRTSGSPVVQIGLPHFFVCDETCYLNQTPAWASEKSASIPGRLISGRFPTSVWPRTLNLAFEWSDFGADFVMKRGEPVCYATFETERPDRPIRLVPGTLTPELADYRSQLEDVVKYTSGSFELFHDAKSIRPSKLLVESS